MKKILIIEDNQEVRENLAEILMLSSYATIEAENGKIGIKQAIAHNPDLIITEWNSKRICSLPLFPDMIREDVDDVVDAIKAVLSK